MSIIVSPLTLGILEALFGYSLPVGLAEEPRRNVAPGFEADYAYRAGYRLGADGAWIARGDPQRSAPGDVSGAGAVFNRRASSTS